MVDNHKYHHLIQDSNAHFSQRQSTGSAKNNMDNKHAVDHEGKRDENAEAADEKKKSRKSKGKKSKGKKSKGKKSKGKKSKGIKIKVLCAFISTLPSS